MSEASAFAPPCLYAFGSNGAGQLGIGHCDDVSEPTRCVFSMSDETSANAPRLEIVKIVAGGNHTLVLTKDGRVFAAGQRLAAGLPANEASCSTSFQEMILVVGVGCDSQNDRQNEAPDLCRPFATDIAATWEASFVVVDRRAIYACGSGSKGELAMGEKVTVNDIPRMIFDIAAFDEQGHEERQSYIESVVACMNHVLVLTTSGTTYGWGVSRKGQLGESLRDMKISWSPRRLQDIPFSTKQVVAGKDFTFAVGDTLHEQRIFGECKNFEIPVLKPTSSADEDSMPKIHAGWSSIVAYTSDGQIQGSGRDHKKQLPRFVEDKIRLVAIGSEHGIAVNTKNQLLAWGWGEHGNCGQPVDDKGVVAGVCNRIPSPGGTVVPDSAISGVGAGCATSFFWYGT